MAPRVSRDELHLPSRRWLLVRGLGVLVLLAVVVFGYQAVRAGLSLRHAQTEAGVLKRQLADGDQAAATRTMRAIARHSHTARVQTDNALWSAVASVPWLGDNVEAVQVVSRVLDDTSRAALPAALRVSSTLTAQELRSSDGRFDLAGIARLRPDFDVMEAASERATGQLDGLEDAALLAPLRNATTELDDQLTTLRSTARAGGTVSRIVPSMLGEDGPRTYLLVTQNNAEIRATGGLPGAFSLLTADDGSLSLGGQRAAVEDFPPRPSPVIPLSAGELALYGTNLGADIRDSNLTPDFPRTAQVMSAMLQARYGQQVDGVISVDPVALAGVLKAIGPVQVGADRFTSKNVVEQLLHRPYQDLPTQPQQNAYFAAAARGIFDALLSKPVDQPSVVRSLADAAGQRRLLVWSRHAEEQDRLRGTPVTGALPTGTGAARQVGMYLNDATGAKIEYYLRHTGSLSSVGCTDAGVQTLKAGLVLSSTAPSDVTGLSPWVTGGGERTPTGSMKMFLRIYAPAGGTITSIEANDEPVSLSTVDHDGRQVAVVGLVLRPEEKIRITAMIKTRADQRADPAAQWTPGIHTRTSGVTAPSACG